MNNNTASNILPTQPPLTSYVPFFTKGVQLTILAGFLSYALLSPATAADFSGSLKGVTITDAQATNKPPTVVSTYSINGDSSITFNASGSTDPDGTITNYKWIFGDGTIKEGAVVTYQPGAQSLSQVTLSLTDNDGAVSLGYINYKISPEWVGNGDSGSIIMANSLDYTFYHKLATTPTTSGVLARYKITLGESGASGRTFNVCLYTHNENTDRPNTQISGSCTGPKEFVGFSAGTDLELTPSGSASVTSGTTYWVGLRQNGYAAIKGNPSTQAYYAIYDGPHSSYDPSNERTFTGTAGKLQIEVKP